jgi:predicted RNase H-like HicB family nuclease
MKRSKRLLNPQGLKSTIKCYSFRAVIEEDAFGDGTKAYHAYLPVLEGCRSWGYTPAEALDSLQETAKLWLQSMKEHGELLPENPEGVEVLPEPRIVVTL